MIKSLYSTVTRKILNINPLKYSPPRRFLIRTLQIFVAMVRDATDGQLSLRAMSLVYTTLITLVPLLALSFSVLKGFEVHKEIETSLLLMLQALGEEKAKEVTAYIIGFVDNIKVGVLGAVGLALLIYAVISLMQKIESAFNYIWRVGENRSLAKRFSDYLSVLLVGPLLIFLSAGITTTIRHSDFITSIEETFALTVIYEFISWLIPWIVMAAGFSFIYMFMPNTKVKMKAALAGGLFAALVWKLMGWIFSVFIANSASYVAIYAAFATLIILMIWLYLSWLVILMGANISFYAQNPRFVKISRGELEISPRMQKSIALGVISIIGNAFYKEEQQKTAEEISVQLNMPILAVQKIISILEESSIITSNRQDPPTYFPAKPFDTTHISDVLKEIDNHGEDEQINPENISLPDKISELINELNKSNDKITNKNINDIL